jgi:hypothetical protein
MPLEGKPNMIRPKDKGEMHDRTFFWLNKKAKW